MSHLDDETIALAAIGEALDANGSGHLAACDACRAEVDSLTRVVSIARSTAGTDVLVAPPPAVWARIAAETGVDPNVRPASLDERRAARGRADDEPPSRSGSGRAGLPPGSEPARAGSRWSGFLVAASVAGIVLGAGGTLAWQALDREEQAPPVEGSTVVASASLVPLPDKVGTGAAEVVDSAAGRELELSLDTDLPTDAFLQVWLLSADTELMVPLGVIAGSTGHWTLPPDVTLADYPIVDVSIEPYDGDPTHSTDSVVRGTLDLSAEAVAALR